MGLQEFPSSLENFAAQPWGSGREAGEFSPDQLGQRAREAGGAPSMQLWAEGAALHDPGQALVPFP